MPSLKLKFYCVSMTMVIYKNNNILVNREKCIEEALRFNTNCLASSPGPSLSQLFNSMFHAEALKSLDRAWR